MAEYVAVAVFVLGVLFGIVGWLLSDKDKKQAEQINDLYTKHNADADKLAALELQIARNHYEKGEVTAMFETFKGYFDEKFSEMKVEIHRINDRRRPTNLQDE